MKKLHKENLITLFIIILFTFLSLLGGSALSVSAETDEELSFDGTYIMDDLEGMTIEGIAFSTDNYPASSGGSMQLLAFVEYGYNFYDALQDNYGLYVYVYNPAKIAIQAKSTLNYIQLRAGGDESASYSKYELEFLSVSSDSGINGLYYKYKFILTDSQKEAILSALDSSERVYEIGEIELLTIGDVNATAYTIANKYTYSGYAAGYGADTSEASTLSCTTAEDVKTISLNVRHTTYRPDGNNGTDEHTQDSLHSVYFSVPNEYIDKYGEMSAIHAIWRDAVLNPVLVTGNSDAYAAIKPYLGVDIGEGTDSIAYGYLTDVKNYINGSFGDYGYNYYSLGIFGQGGADKDITTLYMMFYEADADNAYIDSDTITNKILEMTEQYGGDLVNEKYSSCLFESVADEWTEYNFKSTDETVPLTQITIAEHSWYKYFYFWTDDQYYETSSTTYDNIKAIHKVTEDDFSGTDTENAAELYIDENYYDAFKSYYGAAVEADETVYLLRYQVNNYWSAEATCFHKTTGVLTSLFGMSETTWEVVDTNAFFAQETVNLDFDIIDLTFTKDNVDTVIAVVMSPIDVISALTPPLITTADPSDFWKYGLAIIAALAVVWVVYYIIEKNQSKE